MATRTDYFIQKSLDHVYLNAAITNIGDANGLPAAATAGNLYAALLTESAEADYGAYTRIAIPRTASGFTRALNVMSNVAAVTFAKATSGSNVITKIAIYDRITGGEKLHEQTLSSPITVTTNVQVIIEAGQLTITGA